MFCLHRLQVETCPMCQCVIRSREPMSEERASIVRYLEHVANMPLNESVLGAAHHEGIAFAAAWVKNRLDEIWTREKEGEKKV